jgi:hypothetical protein
MPIFAVTIFTAAFLLFQVQPIIAKYILALVRRRPVGLDHCDALLPSDRSTRLLWLGLPAVASVLLLAVTNQMSQDVAVVPFLWVLPLALYLLSFIIAFDHDKCYNRTVFTVALIPAMAGVVWMLFYGVDAPILLQISVYSISLFICCMACHGKLARLKPHPRYLTSYFLRIAAGGALGGVLVSVVAPHVFNLFFELHMGLLACCALGHKLGQTVGVVRWPASGGVGYNCRWSLSPLSVADPPGESIHGLQHRPLA